jgi:ABC-type sugar transport system ATPase subunit
MAGLLAPDSGEVLIKGKPRKGLIGDGDVVDHLQVGMVFQNAALFDSLTVGENVGFLLYEHSKLSEQRVKVGLPRLYFHACVVIALERVSVASPWIEQVQPFSCQNSRRGAWHAEFGCGKPREGGAERR